MNMTTVRQIIVVLLLTSVASLAPGCKDRPTSPAASAPASAADQEAILLFKQADAFFEQKNADAMEKVLLQALALKPKLSQPQKDRLAGLIVGLGMLDPSRGQKLGKLHGDQ